MSTLLQQSKLGFKKTINWTKYQSKVSMKTRNQYFGFQLIQRFKVLISFLFYHWEIMHIEVVIKND